MQPLRYALVTLFLLSIGACAQNGTKTSSISSAVQACKPCTESSEFSHECPIIVAPCTRARISEIDKILGDLFATKRPIVFYVHGRGDEPSKTSKKHTLDTLEADYGIKVLMINWDSKVPRLFPLYRPVNKAHEGAPLLNDVIKRLAKYRQAHPETKVIDVSLLVHSMGNIVLRKALDNLVLSTADGPIFTNILMTGSDEDAEEHNLWTEKLSARGTILITFNKNDWTLNKSNHPDGKTPLGKNPKQPLAKNAYYLDATGLVGKAHRLFIKGKQHSRVAICQILSTMLRGETPNLEVGSTVERVEHDRVLVPIAKQDKANMCFQGVTDELNEENEEAD